MPDRRAEVVPAPQRGPRHVPRTSSIATVALGIAVAIAGAFIVQRGGLLVPEASLPAAAMTPGGPTPAPGANPSPGTSDADQAALTTAAAAGAASAPSGAVAGMTSGPSSGPGSSSTVSTSGPAESTPRRTLPALTPPPTAPPAPTSQAPGSSSPNPTPKLSPAASGGTATASRLSLLTPCPGRADCYVYVVRAGDNLFNIARFFGVDLDRIRALNAWIGADSTIHPGQHLLIPTPTR